MWQDPVHEVIEIYGTYEHMDICIYHNKKEKVAKSPSTDKSRNLKIYEKIIERGTPLTPRQKFYYARELYYNNKISDAINEFESFLNTNGWIENKIEALVNLSNCYLLLNQNFKAKEVLFKSFALGHPRANILVELSNIYIKEKDYNFALYWLLQIKGLKKNDISGAFIQPDYYDFLPYLNMCVCYYHLGNLQKAITYHKKSEKLRPNDPRVLHNDNFFKTINIIQ